MRKRLSPPPYSPEIATQLTAFWQGVATLELKYDTYFTSTPSRRSQWQEPQPSTLTENLVLQCTKAPVRLSLHPHLPEEIAQETRALFQQLFGA
ncbi:hypothetical protein [Hymenobacter crusticola]|uniref:WW domain-containing protein n=1 Tax=Hymenobacter crusticola TaxID=1770526 RepID=A0A243W6S7_9BACT|nr:hypothetical protein [Hymenobacter crusticola]OUJ70280.1 hypothetical protein BXP70_24600 [Hymenobacter crusticola]